MKTVPLMKLVEQAEAWRYSLAVERVRMRSIRPYDSY